LAEFVFILLAVALEEWPLRFSARRLRMRTRLFVFAGAFLTGCLSTALLFGPFGAGARNEVTSLLKTTSARALPEGLTPDEANSINVFEQTSKSAVFVVNKTLQRDYLTWNVEEVPQGAGTGFIWDTRGHVVTNYHVVQRGRAFSVILSDQSSWEAEFVGAAPDKDVAVLRIRAPQDKLVPIATGSSRDLRVGQKVLAIGNPFGLDQTLTTGVVSALGREIKSLVNRTIRDVIQTDAAINPGNSGGPLLDSQGRLIGVNTAIYSPSGASAGIGFAVPVDTVKMVVPMLIKYGKFKRPSLGADVVPDSWAQQLGIEGVILQRVPPDSAAFKAGLHGTTRSSIGKVELGDVIVSLNGTRVKSFDDLLNLLEKLQVGDTVKLGYMRNGKEQEATAVLQDLPEE
jgi:S1-C subfamily serine protease